MLYENKLRIFNTTLGSCNIEVVGLVVVCPYFPVCFSLIKCRGIKTKRWTINLSAVSNTDNNY